MHVRVFGVLGRVLMNRYVKLLVLCSTLAVLSLGVLGLLRLRMEFKPEWLMNPQSESKFLTLRQS